jgi:threonine dehydrogenase-like Zn-dependent dehydrogenase
MKVLQITGPEHFEIRDVPVPEPGPGQVLMKVLAVTTCPHWDMHILGGRPMLPEWPLEYPYTLGQPGHEACGEVAAVGDGVHEFTIGQRVCAWRDGGHHRPGCYAQFVVKEAEDFIAVPETLAPEACAPLELAMCVSAHVTYAEKIEAVKGKRVGVFGLGPAGLVFVQLLRAAGATEIVGFDPLPERRETAMPLGAARCVDPTGSETDCFPQRGQPGCLHAAFDCVGSPDAVHQAMAVTAELVLLFAVQRESYVFAPRYWGGLALVGTQPHTRAAAEYAVSHLANGSLDLGALVTHTLPLGQYGEAVALLERREALKVAFRPWSE